MSTIITDQNFDEEINNPDKLVLVDFFATWCGPCSVLGPIIEKVAEEFKDQVVLLKVDLDGIPSTAQKFGIDRIPTVVIFKDSKPVDGFVGLLAEGEIVNWLKKVIEKNNGK